MARPSRSTAPSRSAPSAPSFFARLALARERLEILDRTYKRDRDGKFSSGGGGGAATEFGQRVQAGVDESKTVLLSGGQNAVTELVTLSDGSRAIRKTFSTLEGRPAKDQADAEELGSITARAFGVHAPEVVRASADTVYMEHVDATVAATLPREPGSFKVAGSYYGSDQGRVIGLTDALTDNYDRNPGNWMVGQGGTLHAIDHASAFSWYGTYGKPSVAPFGQGNPFNSHLSKPFPHAGEWASNDYSPQDMATARRVLRELRPKFEAMGRSDWHDNALDRLNFIAEHATGDRVRIEAP